MANHTIKISKVSDAPTDQVVDITGAIVVVSSTPKGSITITQIQTAEPTIEAGGACAGIGGYGSGGTISNVKADFMEGKKVDGALAWNVDTQVIMPTASV